MEMILKVYFTVEKRSKNQILMYGVKVASTPQRSSRSKFQELRHVKKRSLIATVFTPFQRHSSERESI